MTARRPQKADWGRMDTSDVTESERSETQYKARPTTLATSLPPLFHLQLTRKEGLLFGQYPRNFPSPSRTNNLTRNQNGGTLPRDCRREPQEKLRTKGGEFRVPTSIANACLCTKRQVPKWSMGKIQRLSETDYCLVNHISSVWFIV